MSTPDMLQIKRPMINDEIPPELCGIEFSHEKDTHEAITCLYYGSGVLQKSIFPTRGDPELAFKQPGGFNGCKQAMDWTFRPIVENEPVKRADAKSLTSYYPMRMIGEMDHLPDLCVGSIGFTGPIGCGKSTVVDNVFPGGHWRMGFTGVPQGVPVIGPGLRITELESGLVVILMPDFDYFISRNLGPDFSAFCLNAVNYYFQQHYWLYCVMAEQKKPYLIVWDRCYLLDAFVFHFLQHNRELQPNQYQYFALSNIGGIMPFVRAVHPRLVFDVTPRFAKEPELNKIYTQIQSRHRPFEVSISREFALDFRQACYALLSIPDLLPPTMLVPLYCGDFNIASPRLSFAWNFLHAIVRTLPLKVSGKLYGISMWVHPVALVQIMVASRERNSTLLQPLIASLSLLLDAYNREKLSDARRPTSPAVE